LIKRSLSVEKIKKERLEEYIKAHDNIWPKLEEEYRIAGVTNLSCFMKDCELFIFFEYEDTIWDKINRNEMKVDKKWQKYMAGFSDPDFKGYKTREIYNLNK